MLAMLLYKLQGAITIFYLKTLVHCGELGPTWTWK